MQFTKINFLFLLFISSCSLVWGQDEIDVRLKEYIKIFQFKPLQEKTISNKDLFAAGKILFEDKILSGNRNISCKDCHDPAKGTSDNLALALGEGAIVNGPQREQGLAKIIRRNSPNLFNLQDIPIMFWDGRVSYDAQNNIYATPEKDFNGANPVAAEIVNIFNGALSAQTIFPIVSHDEMRGAVGTNEVADAKTDLEAWEVVVGRVRNERPKLFTLLSDAFQLSSVDEVNIGHFARAMAEFIAYEFQVTNTPFDKYLRGDLTALDTKAKRGMDVYSNKGRCANCHFGDNLTNLSFMNIGTPKLQAEKDLAIDLGVYEVTGVPTHKYLFKTPQLRNVSESAPYMHNGVFQTLEEVVDHYNTVHYSLMHFKPSPDLDIPYSQPLFRVYDHAVNHEIYQGVFQPFLRAGLGLTKDEKEDLVYFLKYALKNNHTF